VTIGNTIYFVRGMNFGDPNDGWTLFHELEHVVQYANRGGVEPFLSEYVLNPHAPDDALSCAVRTPIQI
jgi:Domain of unknown function (DUF4157)